MQLGVGRDGARGTGGVLLFTLLAHKPWTARRRRFSGLGQEEGPSRECWRQLNWAPRPEPGKPGQPVNTVRPGPNPAFEIELGQYDDTEHSTEVIYS